MDLSKGIIRNSEVQDNSNLVEIGMKLIYMDDANFMKFKVNDVDEFGFEAIDLETGGIDWYNFEELQCGWKFADQSILNN